MAQKPFALESRKFGLLFHNLSEILHLLLSLKTKSTLGLGTAATADCAKLLSQTLTSSDVNFFGFLYAEHCIVFSNLPF